MLTPDEVERILKALDTRTRLTQADVSYIRGRLGSLSIKVAALSGVVATIVSFLAAK